MKLIVAIVHREDAQQVVAALSKHGCCTTCMTSQGSFLGQENRTLLTGVADERVKEVVGHIRGAVHWRSEDHPGKTPENSMLTTADEQITVAGATIFVLNVDQFLRL